MKEDAKAGDQPQDEGGKEGGDGDKEHGDRDQEEEEEEKEGKLNVEINILAIHSTRRQRIVLKSLGDDCCVMRCHF